MKRYLFTWECGAGLGHLARYKPLIELLLERGHEVTFACKNLQNAQRIYGQLSVNLIQAPIHQRQPAEMISPRSYVDVLINQGFEHSTDLKARVNVWLELLERSQPSVIIADHSPTVLLAQRLYERAPCIVGGNGFCIPPVVHPFPRFDKQRSGSREGLIQRERDLLNSVINPVLQDLGGQSMKRCQELFSDHPLWLFGLASLDHYPGQRAQTYLGTSPSIGGEPAAWPDLPGPRVFAYLKTNHALDHALKILKQLQWPTLVYAPELPDESKREAQGPSMQFSSKPLDLQSVAQSCRLAVNNGGMNGVTALLLEGVPQLLLPLHIEQLMFSRSAETTGACRVHTDWNEPGKLRGALEALADPAGANKLAAVKFSRRQRHKETTVQAEYLLSELERM